MKAWRTSEGVFRAVELPTPMPGDGEIWVAVEAVAVTELDRRAGDERTPGGAAVGRVEACGAAADHLAGARVLVGPAWPCGECDVCRRGAAASCPRGRTLGVDADGTLATHVIAPARWVCPLEGDLEIAGPTAALAARELALAYAMTARAGVGPGDPVVALGDGVVSRLIAAVAVEKGTSPIVISDDAGYAATLEAAGGRAVHGDGDALVGAVRAAAATLQLGERPWRLFADLGDDRAGARMLSLLGPGATVTVGGGRAATATALPLGRVAALGATVLGVAHAHPDLLTEAAALAATGAIDLASYAEVRAVAELEGALPTAPRGRALVLTVAPAT